VALARALLVQSELLILDDVSSALDSATEAGILQNLRQQQSRTILASSTRPAIVAAADTIIVVADGRVVGTGTLAELLRTNTTMQALWSDIQRPEAPRAE
jgi:ABC-type multidrug transport system fused ATPase/permease subunit